MDFTFTRPVYLFLLFIIPLFVIIHFLSLRTRKGDALRFANFEALARIRGVDIYSKNLSLVIFTSVIALLLIFSVSGLTVHTTARTSFFSFVIAVDSSQSMEATDVLPTRFDAAKETASRFIDSSGIATHIGLVSFSGSALIEQEPTDDKSMLLTKLDAIQLSSIGGTDIYEAVVTSVNLLLSEERRALILFSDGQLNVGNLNSAIDYAQKHNVIIHTVAVGTLEGGDTTYGLSKIDEDSLQALAYNTYGTYSLLSDESSMEAFLTEIASVKLGSISLNMASYLIITALCLLVIGFVIIDFRYRLF